MPICAAGDIHGAMDRMYEDVLPFEAALGAPFGWVLHVGDFGVWPDPHRVDKATMKHDGAGDFPTCSPSAGGFREAPALTRGARTQRRDTHASDQRRPYAPQRHACL